MPTETPFVSGIGKVKATNTLHEWQTDALDAASNNKQVEGDDVAAFNYTPPVRLGNYCQISRKAFSVSGTTEAVLKAGRRSEIAYQATKAGRALKTDMEFACTQNGTYNNGSGAVARQTRGLEGWIATNNDLGATGVPPNYNTNTAATDGTARAFTEVMLKNVAQLCWAQGGNPNVLMLGGAQKQVMSTFSGNSTRFDRGEDQKLYAAIQVYVSDFTTLNIMPNRFQRARTAFLLDMNFWRLASLRPITTELLAKTGDAEKRLIITEYTLEAGQEKSSGAVRDLT
jgi:uncharacterized protein DUF5309